MQAMAFTDEYLESKVLTATPHQLHLLVIDGAIRHATAAEAALQSGDLSQAVTQLGRSNQFVAELIAGLKSTQQPHLVDRLKSLFIFVQQTLADADRRHDPRRVAEALAILRMHRKTWLALGEKLSQEAQESAPHRAESHAGFSWTS
jgi:flagellar protein FliS